MAQPCSVALGVPSRGVQRILDAADMTEVLAIYDLEADAVQACGRPADDYAYLSSAGLSRHPLLHRI